jgi:hypothetical protein
MSSETVFPHGPALSSFLDDLLGMFEANDEGLNLDAELCRYFIEALTEAKPKAEALERFAMAYCIDPHLHRQPAARQALARRTVSIGNVAVFPIANRLIEGAGAVAFGQEEKHHADE